MTPLVEDEGILFARKRAGRQRRKTLKVETGEEAEQGIWPLAFEATELNVNDPEVTNRQVK